MTISVYIATSLDGFIARPDGGLDWLPGAEPEGAEKAGDNHASSGGEAVEDLRLANGTTGRRQSLY